MKSFRGTWSVRRPHRLLVLLRTFEFVLHTIARYTLHSICRFIYLFIYLLVIIIIIYFFNDFILLKMYVLRGKPLFQGLPSKPSLDKIY